MATTNIEWSDMVWNPTTGCRRVSPGCDHCYAIREAARMTSHPNPKIQSIYDGLTVHRSGRTDWAGHVQSMPERLDQPLHWRKPRRIFVNSMSDLFHEEVSYAFLNQIWAVMKQTPQHTYQILTKRPQRMADYCQWALVHAHHSTLPNVWLGVSVENQHYAEERLPWLLEAPAVLHWLSCEPLLGPVNLRTVTCRDGDDLGDTLYNHGTGAGIDWVVVGGESGPGARPMGHLWVKDLLKQCDDAQIPFFLKQWYQTGASRTFKDFTLFPDDVRRRNYPESCASTGLPLGGA